MAVETREEEIQILKSEISRLLTENKKLHEEKESLIIERDSLREDSKSMFSDILELQSSNEENLVEIRQLKKEIDGLVEGKEKREKGIDLMVDDSTSILLSIFEAQKEVEDELERKNRIVGVISEKVLMMMKKTADMVRGWEGENEGVSFGFEFVEMEEVEEIEEDEELMVVIPFAAELRAIERGFKKREWEMEEMKRELEILKVSVDEE
ncbi:uncharacterized protein LOC143851151 [Tasmannia lanceolata]|uniref:uncharacterized protein LOC143851151 n=1 Tax=Tasmannia lanceolata TaxID=3420 RepID=UPI004062FDB8